ncbi:hypothetical protein ABES25_04100 [Bacillus gobiensis]|uniref:hypothetical protein n=1 Tax=Bacillus gobiensis TaxID=1441095 RepID=UPI003D1DC8BC
MKKWLILSVLIITGFFATGVSSDIVEAEDQDLDPIGDKIGWEDGRSDVEDPVVANDGLEDGVDNSMVQPKITKVSDDIDLLPSEFGE